MGFSFVLAIPEFWFCDFLLDEVQEFLAGPQQQTLNEVNGDCLRTISTAEAMLHRCHEMQQRIGTMRETRGDGSAPALCRALEDLTLGRSLLYESLLLSNTAGQKARVLAVAHLAKALEGFRAAGDTTHTPRGLLTRAWLRWSEHDAEGARSDLDEARQMAERGSMRLHMADIHLQRARLFFREKTYPWTSPRADLVEARQFIKSCGYWRREKALDEAERVILALCRMCYRLKSPLIPEFWRNTSLSAATSLADGGARGVLEASRGLGLA